MFEACGIPVQETLLGTYGGRVVVGCLDFVKTSDEATALLPFSRIENSVVSSSERGRYPALETMYSVFDAYDGLQGLREPAIERYWDTFVVDAVIGNFDRHGGNWGYLIDEGRERIVGLAPVYDCGSSFTPSLSEDAMGTLMQDADAMTERALRFPKAALTLGGRKLAYQDVMMSPEIGREARRALLRLRPRLESLDVYGIARGQEGISDVRAAYAQAMVESRYDVLLRPAIELALEEQEG